MLRRILLLCVLLALPGVRLLAATATDEQLEKQASAEAVDELKFHLIKEYTRVSELAVKVRSAERVPGWRRIRVSGNAAFATWSKRERDYVWRSGKFSVDFDLTPDNELQAASVTFDGIERPVNP